MAWELEDGSSIPNMPYTRTAILRGPRGHCKLMGWVQGCSLNGLESLSDLGSCKEEDWPEFRDTLAKLCTNLGTDGPAWNTKRWMFTMTDSCREFSARPGTLLCELVKASRLVDSFINRSHGGATIHMYFLEF